MFDAKKRKGPTTSIGVVGISYRSPDFRLARALRLTEHPRREILDALQRELGFCELVHLCTCNRVEIIYSATEPLSGADDPRVERLVERFGLPREVVPSLHFVTDDAAVRYVFEVASALDSMVIGEAQILGQFKRAFEDARDEGRCGHLLQRLFDGAVRVARKVRNETSLGQGKLSLMSLIGDEVRAYLSGVEKPRIALVGAGEMIDKVIGFIEDGHFDTARLIFVNRTFDRAEALAREHGGDPMSLEHFRSDPPTLDLLVTATSAPDPLFDRKHCAALASDRADETRMLAVDLAVPCDVAEDAAELDCIEVVNVESLRGRAEQNRRARRKELQRGRDLVECAVSRFRKEGDEVRLGEIAAALEKALRGSVGSQLPASVSNEWPGLLLRRAHKVGMVHVRRHLTPGLHHSDATKLGRTTNDEIRAAMSHPEMLGRKAYRRLPRDAQLELEAWFTPEVEKLTAVVSTTLQHVESYRTCSDLRFE